MCEPRRARRILGERTERRRCETMSENTDKLNRLYDDMQREMDKQARGEHSMPLLVGRDVGELHVA